MVYHNLTGLILYMCSYRAITEDWNSLVNNFFLEGIKMRELCWIIFLKNINKKHKVEREKCEINKKLYPVKAPPIFGRELKLEQDKENSHQRYGKIIEMKLKLKQPNYILTIYMSWMCKNKATIYIYDYNPSTHHPHIIKFYPTLHISGYKWNTPREKREYELMLNIRIILKIKKCVLYIIIQWVCAILFFFFIYISLIRFS